MIRAAIFDLDGTLFDRATSIRRLIEGQYQRYAEVLASVPSATYVERFLELDARGYTPKDEVYVQLVGESMLETEMQSVLFADFYAHYHKNVIGFSGLHDTLDELRHAGTKLGIITNGGATYQQATIDALEIARKFDAILISEREGVRKPAAEIFRRALILLNVEAAEAVYIGDHPEVDINGAQSAGLRAVWKRDVYWGECGSAHAEIDSLRELPSLLESWS